MPNKSLNPNLNKQKQKNIPAFLKKTYNMLQNSENEEYIHWSPNGIGFIILNEQVLTKRLLPKYFKHSNYSSFIRQLNMYDFHKIRKGNIDNYFHHDKFIKNDINSISKIKRKPQKKKSKFFNNNMKRNNEQQQQFDIRKNNHNTQITLNSIRTIKHKSQQLLSLHSCPQQNLKKKQPIYDEQQYQYKYNIDQNRFSNIEFNCEQQQQEEQQNYFDNNLEEQSNQKMSINNQINNQENQKQANNHVVQFNVNVNNVMNQFNMRNGYFMNVYHHHFANYGGFMI